MLKRLEICSGKLVEAGEGGHLLVFINPDDAERKYLVEQAGLDEHNLVSALDPDEQSRVEFEPDHAAIIFKRPRSYSSDDNFLFKVSSMGMFVFKDHMIIVLSEDVPLLEGKQFLKVTGMQDIMLKAMFRCIVHFREHLRVINGLSESLEHKINSSMQNKYLLNLFTLEKGLVYYLNAIHTNGVLIDKLKSGASKLSLSPENVEFLDDIGIENTQSYKQAEIYSNILASLMDARASIVSNNLNVLMKTLNIITVGIMLPTLVVSAFSMNVGIPLHDHPMAFWIILAMSAVPVITFTLIWRYKRW